MAGERYAEQRESGDRNPDSRPLPPRERRVGRPLDEQREQTDPARRDGLDERQGSEPQSGDVQSPASQPDREAGKPGEVREERAQRADRVPKRQRRHLRRLAVLAEEAPVQRSSRSEREQQPARKRRTHLRSRPLKGR